MKMNMKQKIATLFLALLIFLPACASNTDTPNVTEPVSPTTEAPETEKQLTQEEIEQMKWSFDGIISKEVLCNYLSRAVTISLENNFVLASGTDHVKSFILNTGAKYICRAATCWSPSAKDLTTFEGQKAFIEELHAVDPTIVFEACIFECISKAVNEIAIPAYVFEAFGLEAQERNFDFDQMRYISGKYLNQWGADTAVPDISRIETQMFFYYRATSYIDLGFEALHLGQVHMMGAADKDYKSFTKVCSMIRAYAKENARRHFVFLNAHTHGLKGSDGKLLFDFHMFPSRPVADGTEAHFPTEENPQKAVFDPSHRDSIYGKSMGGTTYSGWSCDSLPYLVELDNYGYDEATLFVPNPSDWRVWGMDEISWYANQPASYRAEFLSYAYDWVMNEAPGDGFFAMPGQRTAYLFREDKTVYSWQYFAYDPENYKGGFGDEAAIKSIWESEDAA